MSHFQELPLPPHFDPARVGEIWPVPYQERARQAQDWARQHDLGPAARDAPRIALVAIDVQNSFCIPGFELFVGGRSGLGAVEDNRRLCAFIYRNLGNLTHLAATLDTHTAMQIFHPVFLVDAQGQNPPPLTLVSVADLEQGRWRFNPQLAHSLGIDPDYGQQHLLHYAQTLKARGKYDLTIWPYHVMLGSLGHALVPALEEAFFFHTIARSDQAEFDLKGDHPLTEHYSVIGPEVTEGPDGQPLAGRSSKFLQRLQQFDAVILAGQAKSHCVAWTIDDLLSDIRQQDARLASKVYLLEDCTSPVVVPGVVDYTGAADEAFARFAAAGMHVVRSSEPLASWPGLSGT